MKNFSYDAEKLRPIDMGSGNFEAYSKVMKEIKEFFNIWVSTLPDVDLFQVPNCY